MVIFNSYVKLPEGRCLGSRTPSHKMDQKSGTIIADSTTSQSQVLKRSLVEQADHSRQDPGRPPSPRLSIGQWLGHVPTHRPVPIMERRSKKALGGWLGP